MFTGRWMCRVGFSLVAIGRGCLTQVPGWPSMCISRLILISLSLRGLFPQVQNLSGGARFIAWRPWCPSLGESWWSTMNFWDCWAHGGFNPAPRPLPKRPCDILVQLVGHTTNTSTNSSCSGSLSYRCFCIPIVVITKLRTCSEYHKNCWYVWSIIKLLTWMKIADKFGVSWNWRHVRSIIKIVDTFRVSWKLLTRSEYHENCWHVRSIMKIVDTFGVSWKLLTRSEYHENCWHVRSIMKIVDTFGVSWKLLTRSEYHNNGWHVRSIMKIVDTFGESWIKSVDTFGVS